MQCSTGAGAAVLVAAELPPQPQGRPGREQWQGERRSVEGVEWVRGEERTNYPFILSVDDLGEGFRLTAQTVEGIGAERVCGYMERVLETMVEALEKEPGKAVRSIAVLSEEERQQVVNEWNRTEAGGGD